MNLKQQRRRKERKKSVPDLAVGRIARKRGGGTRGREGRIFERAAWGQRAIRREDRISRRQQKRHGGGSWNRGCSYYKTPGRGMPEFAKERGAGKPKEGDVGATRGVRGLQPRSDHQTSGRRPSGGTWGSHSRYTGVLSEFSLEHRDGKGSGNLGDERRSLHRPTT